MGEEIYKSIENIEKKRVRMRFSREKRGRIGGCRCRGMRALKGVFGGCGVSRFNF